MIWFLKNEILTEVFKFILNLIFCIGCNLSCINSLQCIINDVHGHFSIEILRSEHICHVVYSYWMALASFDIDLCSTICDHFQQFHCALMALWLIWLS